MAVGQLFIFKLFKCSGEKRRKISCHVEVHKERTSVQLSINDQTNSGNCEKTGTSKGLRDRLDGHCAEELVYFRHFLRLRIAWLLINISLLR